MMFHVEAGVQELFRDLNNINDGSHVPYETNLKQCIQRRFVSCVTTIY
jgi:hypothetical protein